jgi:hypothetical protein
MCESLRSNCDPGFIQLEQNRHMETDFVEAAHPQFNSPDYKSPLFEKGLGKLVGHAHPLQSRIGAKS